MQRHQQTQTTSTETVWQHNTPHVNFLGSILIPDIKILRLTTVGMVISTGLQCWTATLEANKLLSRNGRPHPFRYSPAQHYFSFPCYYNSPLPHIHENAILSCIPTTPPPKKPYVSRASCLQLLPDYRNDFHAPVYGISIYHYRKRKLNRSTN